MVLDPLWEIFEEFTLEKGTEKSWVSLSLDAYGSSK